jgi:hypothetical protein
MSEPRCTICSEPPCGEVFNAPMCLTHLSEVEEDLSQLEEANAYLLEA